MKAYKFLTEAGSGRFSDFRWPRPNGEEPGAWVDASGELEECRHGVHACTPEQMLDWLDDELWEVELGGKILHQEARLVSERARLVTRVHGWNARTAQEFAEVCVWRARTYAVASLRRSGLTGEAQRLVDAADPGELQTRAVAASERAEGPAAELSAFAADAVSLARGQRPETWDAETAPLLEEPVSTPAAIAANLAFVAAHMAGRDAVAAGGADTAYDAAFADERRWQLTWLDERLGVREP